MKNEMTKGYFGGHWTINGEAEYHQIYEDGTAKIDGHFTPEQLRKLAEAIEAVKVAD